MSYLKAWQPKLPFGTKGIYFITFTCHHWLPLIHTAGAYEDVYNFFAVLNQKGHRVAGYVIMPNHFFLRESPARVTIYVLGQAKSKKLTSVN